MLIFAFQSEIWIAQNLNFTVFKDFCLSLSWKYRFSQNVNHTKVQSKTNKYCKFHDDLTGRRLSKSQFKKLGMVPKKLYRNTLIFTEVHVNTETILVKKNCNIIDLRNELQCTPQCHKVASTHRTGQALSHLKFNILIEVSKVVICIFRTEIPFYFQKKPYVSGLMMAGKKDSFC